MGEHAAALETLLGAIDRGLTADPEIYRSLAKEFEALGDEPAAGEAWAAFAARRPGGANAP